MSHLNIAFNRYASIGTVMHYILVTSIPLSAFSKDAKSEYAQGHNKRTYLYTFPSILNVKQRSCEYQFFIHLVWRDEESEF